MAEVAADMAHDGILDPARSERYVLPVYARTVDEARAPLARADSPVHDAFTEIECRTDPVANPYFTKWLSDHDSAAYAASYAAFVRGFTESSLREHLFGPGRDRRRRRRRRRRVLHPAHGSLRGRSRARPVRRLDIDRRTRPQLKGHTPWDASTQKVALITGGARGQGAAEAALFASEGATVYLTDVLVDEGAATATAIGGTFLEHDVTSPEQWAGVVDRVVADQGGVDVLVNNAGILHWATMTETELDDWNRVIAVNQTGVFLGMRAVAPPMIAARRRLDREHLVDRRHARRRRPASRTARPSGRCAG